MEKPAASKKRAASSTEKKIKKAKPQPVAEFAKWKPFPAGAQVHTPNQRKNPAVKRREGGSYGFAYLKGLPVGYSTREEYDKALQWGIIQQHIPAENSDEEAYYQRRPSERPKAYYQLKRSKKTGKMKKKQLYGDPRDFERMAYAAGRL